MTFLMVDDDADERSLFRKALQKIKPDSDCFMASNGKEALNLLSDKEHLPDIIFLDINMPVMTGWECLTKLKSNPELKEIPVVMYSTSSNQRDINIAFDLGAECFCTKPDDFYGIQDALNFISERLESNFEDIAKFVEKINGIVFNPYNINK